MSFSKPKMASWTGSIRTLVLKEMNLYAWVVPKTSLRRVLYFPTANMFDFNEQTKQPILLLLPAVAVIVMAVCKCPSIPTLMVSTLVAVVLAMLVQGQTLSGILNILDSGFSIDTALPEFNRLVNRGGLQSMPWTAALGILGMLYGSIMEKAGLLEALLSKMDPLVKSTGGLVTAVVLTCTLLLMATASQTLAIVVGGRMYIGEFKKKNLLPQTLSRTLEDSGTIISPLVPWSLCGAYMAGTLGVSTMSYLPLSLIHI